MSEIKSCPWCGGEVKANEYEYPDWLEVDNSWHIDHVDRAKAINAGCPYEYASYNSEQEAIDAWNTRAEEAER